jgi:hypothetical protein
MLITSALLILKYLDFLERQTYLINLNSERNDANESYFRTEIHILFSCTKLKLLPQINSYTNVNSRLPVRSLHIQNPCS